MEAFYSIADAPEIDPAELINASKNTRLISYEAGIFLIVTFHLLNDIAVEGFPFWCR